jgi:DNA-binding response OmpR family regulator
MTTPSILVVDDNPVLETFKRMLKLEGFGVYTAGDAEAGLAAAAAQTVDAIILDMRMPLVDGLGFLRRLRAGDRLNETPVAIVTGDYLLDDDTIDAANTLGAVVKFKPLWLDELV